MSIRKDMKEVAIWTTSDGIEFYSSEDARRHEVELIVREHFYRYMDDYDIAKMIVENIDKFREALL